MTHYDLYKLMLTIRRFEERALEEFSTGKLFGTTHAYIGQEADAAAVFSALDPGDVVFSNHRCHGHFLAYGGDPYRLAAELMGKATGLVGGRGGSQHIHWRNFYSNGIQGGIVPVAAGMALAEKKRHTGQIAVVFIGDGTLGEGALYESLNIASLWQLPVLCVLENNRYAQTTPVELGVAGSMAARFKAFGIQTWEAASSDVLTLQPVAREAVDHARSGLPAALILHTHRFSAHSKGDDLRPREQIAKIRAAHDPLDIHSPRLSAAELTQAETEVAVLLDDAFARANEADFPMIQLSSDSASSPDLTEQLVQYQAGQPEHRMTVLESLNAALHSAMQADERVYLFGEDILDPYGGAFKVTRGLSTGFPERVMTTPISEAAILGIANGMALRGLRPVAEVMFGDFVTLMADQLINHAAKFRWMYNDQARVPLVLRLPMGGRRGYGPTHSQSLEKLFLGVPGLRVVAPSTLGNPAQLLEHAILRDDDPVLFVEHKLLYTRPLLEARDLEDWDVEASAGPYPTFSLRIQGIETPGFTLATYGYNFELARQAAQELAYEDEIFCDIIVFSQLSPFNLEPLMASLRLTRRLLTLEEGTQSLGWGAEVAARAAEQVPGSVIRRLGAQELPIANAKSLEDEILPSVERIIHLARAMLNK
jgi:2-oxoisovalerate dehydrogenase E1 component